MDKEEVSHSQIYHKLGTLEGLLLGVQQTLAQHAVQGDRLEDRVNQLERNDSSGHGAAKTGGWLAGVIAVPLALALLSWGLTQWAPTPRSRDAGPGHQGQGHTLTPSR